MFEETSIDLQIILILIVGFLAGMIPAMLFIGFYGGRKVEKQRRALQLKYDRQINTLRATVKRLMNRIESLTTERNLLKRSNNSLRKAIRDQHQITDEAVQRLEDTRAVNAVLEKKVEELAEDNLRHEGRLEQAVVNQENMATHFQFTITQFSEAEKLRRHLLFATNQLREAHSINQALESQFNQQSQVDGDEDNQVITPDQMDILNIAGIEPENAEKLHESGIHTVADLAKQTPERVAYFTGLSGWDESAAWIAEAKARISGSKGLQA